MSMQGVRDFWQRIEEDQPIRKQLEAIEADSRRQAHETILRIANAAGFSFTLEEYEAAVEERIAKMHAASELTDKEMSGAAGGLSMGIVVSVSVASRAR